MSALHACLLTQGAETNWQFDIFALAEETPGYTLSLLAIYLHKALGWMSSFDETKFTRFVRLIEKGYVATNPYHNRSDSASSIAGHSSHSPY